MKWFKNIGTIEELKKEYKKLAFKNHPDVGGNESDMKEINAEYETLFERLKNVHSDAEGRTYTTGKTTKETAEQFKEIIEKLIRMIGIKIEICGSWVWVSGSTYEYRKELGEIGFRFSKTKRAWYYASDLSSKRRGKHSMNQIRAMYGSEEVATVDNLRITAV